MSTGWYSGWQWYAHSLWLKWLYNCPPPTIMLRIRLFLLIPCVERESLGSEIGKCQLTNVISQSITRCGAGKVLSSTWSAWNRRAPLLLSSTSAPAPSSWRALYTRAASMNIITIIIITTRSRTQLLPVPVERRKKKSFSLSLDMCSRWLSRQERNIGNTLTINLQTLILPPEFLNRIQLNWWRHSWHSRTNNCRLEEAVRV